MAFDDVQSVADGTAVRLMQSKVSCSHRHIVISSIINQILYMMLNSGTCKR